MTRSPFRARTGPLYFANKVLNIYDINDYITGTFMYECLHGNIPFRKFSIKIAGPNLWNYLLSSVKNSETVHIFKKNMRHYLTERKGYT